MSSERLESIEDELKALLDHVQNSITYQLPTKVGGKFFDQRFVGWVGGYSVMIFYGMGW